MNKMGEYGPLLWVVRMAIELKYINTPIETERELIYVGFFCLFYKIQYYCPCKLLYLEPVTNKGTCEIINIKLAWIHLEKYCLEPTGLSKAQSKKLEKRLRKVERLSVIYYQKRTCKKVFFLALTSIPLILLKKSTKTNKNCKNFLNSL